MIIYPAIDLKDGACVRLYQGDMNQVTIYNESPAEQALSFAKEGCSWLHLVDLDGAVKGHPVNVEAVKEIIDRVDLPVQLGGGIRTEHDIEQWLEAGVNRVILGTKLVKDPSTAKDLCRKYPDQIVVGIDGDGEHVMVEGWLEKSDIKVQDLIQDFEEAGAAAVIYTDTRRDGTEQGLDTDNIKRLAGGTSLPFIVAGGVATLEDLKAMKAIEDSCGVNGVVIGRAFYENAFTPKEALAQC